MLLKSNKFFDLKSKKTLVKLVIQKLILLKTCHHTVEHWQLSINLCQFFNFLSLVTGESYLFLRFNLYTYIYVKLRYKTAQEVPFLEFHIPRYCDRHIFPLFLTKHFELAQFLMFCNGTFTILMLNFSV